MTGPERRDAVIAAYFRQPQADLPDPVFDIVRGEIHRTRQRVVVGPVMAPDARIWRATLAAVVVVVVVAVAWFGSLPAAGPGGPRPTPTPRPTSGTSLASGPGTLPSPTGPSLFVSPLYGYSLTLPAGWESFPASTRWDGQTQPGFGDADTDGFDGPRQIVMLAFAGSFSGTVQDLADNRIAANARDHSDTCPPDALQVNEPIDVAGQAGALLGWNCGALINEALTIRDGVAYSFTLRDLGIRAARDPTDVALLQSILDSVQLPATPPVSSP